MLTFDWHPTPHGLEAIAHCETQIRTENGQWNYCHSERTADGEWPGLPPQARLPEADSASESLAPSEVVRQLTLPGLEVEG